ncbi:hypothetical protein [Xenorhabdus indica]|uniref:hypothetical protein n=1 Tax=Xenorhabdus indica TaxID=333964 RepID=UPI0016571D40|nr:hypothetical protein [Xenorhabdus indica]
MRLSDLHRHQTDDICFQRGADVPHRGVLPYRLRECCCRCPKVILTSDRIMDKSDYANQQKSSGQWVIHFPGQKNNVRSTTEFLESQGETVNTP